MTNQKRNYNFITSLPRRASANPDAMKNFSSLCLAKNQNKFKKSNEELNNINSTQ